MQKNKIGLYQTGILAFFFTRCFFLLGLIPLLFQSSGIDSLISIILGTIFGSGIVFFYFKLIKKMDGENLFDTINNRLPKVFSILFLMIILLGLIMLGSFSLSNISLYINNSFSMNISLTIISASFLIICHFMAKEGLESLGRAGEILFMVFILLFLLSILGVIPLTEPTRIKPFFSKDITKIGSSSLLYGFFNSVPLFFITLIPTKQIKDSHKLVKFIFIGYFIASLTIFITFLVIIGTLGIDLASFYQYPETAILKKVSYFKFIERGEGILALNWLIDGIMVISFLCYSIKECLSKFLSKKIVYWGYNFLLIAIIYCSKINLSLQQIILPFTIIFLMLPVFLLLQLYFTKKKKNS